MNDETPSPSISPAARHGSSWPLIALLFLAAGTLLVVQMKRPSPTGPIVGQPLPPLEAAGWLNTSGPLTISDLRGKIVVVDFFASWCPECLQGLPDLAAFRQRYKEQGVMLVGLTDEGLDKLAEIREFNSSVPGIDWPIGYGAGLAFHMLGIEGIPEYILYDRAGRAVWEGASVEDLEEATVKLLAKEK